MDFVRFVSLYIQSLFMYLT